MYKIHIVLFALLLAANTFAQAPDQMSYQAVVRDNLNNPVSSQAVGMQISVLQTNSTGTAVYVETQTPTTNLNGLISIKVGAGTVVSGDFAAIDWAAGPYFIKTETDPTGGTSYTITGTTQMLSVPYALHANTAGNAFSGNYNDLTNKPGIELYGDIKEGFQSADHNGWIKLDGRLLSTLTTEQQAQAAVLGFVTNLPNATNAYLSQNEDTLGHLTGSNTKYIAQNQLPNVTLTGTTATDGNHAHALSLSGSLTGGLGINGNLVTVGGSGSDSSAPVTSSGNHNHELTTSSINGGETQVALDATPLTMSVNVFVFLGN